MGAAADCELFTQSLLGQPFNSLTSLAFVAAGVIVAREPRIRWIGIGLIATGMGSFVFHGPAIPASEWAHDVSLAWLILLFSGLGSPWERWTRLTGLVAIGVVFALLPGFADPTAAVLAVIAVGSILRADKSRETWFLLGALGVVAIIGRLGATGGPLCTPESLWQWHGLWHLGSAAIATRLAVRWDRQRPTIYAA